MMSESRLESARGDDAENGDAHNNNMSPETVPRANGVKSPICTNPEISQIAAKVDALKNWTVHRFKTTKNTVIAQLGKVDRTIDTDMDNRISMLYDLHNRYRDVLNYARTYADHCVALNNSQRLLAESFYQLSLREVEIRQSLADRSEVLRAFSHNGDNLKKSLDYFVSSLETLCDKTIKDTLMTVHVYEQARLDYDVHRYELTQIKQQVEADQKLVAEAEAKVGASRQKYESLKEDVKLTLLEENRLKVMNSQLAHFEKGLSNWFVENIKSLEQNSPSSSKPDDDQHFVRGVADAGLKSSFLEQ